MRIARRVAHPNVCRVFDIGEAGLYYPWTLDPGAGYLRATVGAVLAGWLPEER